MISEFEDMMGAAFVEALGIFGESDFTLNGATYRGSLDELGNESYALTQGGREVLVSAHLTCTRPQFSGAIPKAGTRILLVEENRWLVIAAVSRDAISVTLALADPDAH